MDKYSQAISSKYKRFKLKQIKCENKRGFKENFCISCVVFPILQNVTRVVIYSALVDMVIVKSKPRGLISLTKPLHHPHLTIKTLTRGDSSSMLTFLTLINATSHQSILQMLCRSVLKAASALT